MFLSRRSFKELGLFTLLMIAGLLVLYGQVLSGQSALYFRDILHNYYVFLEFMKTSLWNGELPFWNGFVFSGAPLLAGLEPPLFYPLSWMFFLLPFQLALGLNLCLHHLIAGLGVYLLGREYRWSSLACMVAGLCFSFGGIMISMNNFHPLQNTVAWIPVLLWLAHRICERSDRRALLGFSLAYGLQIVSGHLEIVYFTSLLLLSYACLFLRVEGGIRRVSWLVPALTLGILLSAVQLLPSLMYVPYSIRKSGLNTFESTVWSFHPVLSSMFILPENNGNVFDGIGLYMVFGDKSFANSLFFVSSYMGVLSWCGMIMALRYLKTGQERKFVIFWLVVLLVTLVMAYGHYLPTGSWLPYMPGMSFFRYPSKFLVITSLAFAILAGWGLNELELEPVRVNHLIRTLSGLVGFCLLVGVLIVAFRSGLDHELIWRVKGLHQHMTDKLAASWAGDTVNQLYSQLLRQGLVCFAFAAGLWLCLRLKINTIGLSLLVLGLTSLDLLASGINAVWMTSSEIMKMSSPVADFLYKQELHLHPQERYLLANQADSIPLDYRGDMAGMVYFRPIIYGIDSLGDNYGVLHGFRSAYGHWPASPYLGEHFQQLYKQALNHSDLAFRNLLESQSAVRYLLFHNPPASLLKLYDASNAYQQQRFFAETQTYLYENKSWLPRARFYYQSATAKDEPGLLKMLSESVAYNENFKKIVVLLEDQALQQARARVPSQEAKFKRWTPPEITSESNHAVELTFETNTSGYLVLADQYIPGWKAYDNGQEVPILRANFFHRALRVGPGQHQIRFEYQPPGFRAGLIITAFSALIWLILLFLMRNNFNQKPRIETVKLEEVFKEG